MGSSHLSPVKILINTPLGARIFITFVFHHPKRKESLSLYPSKLPIVCVLRNEEKSLWERSWGFKTSKDVNLILQHLEFKV